MVKVRTHNLGPSRPAVSKAASKLRQTGGPTHTTTHGSIAPLVVMKASGEGALVRW